MKRFVDELDNLDCHPLNGKLLTEEMHKRGINMRYLGRIAQSAKLSHIRELCVREMLARTIKVLIRDGLSFLERVDTEDAKAWRIFYCLSSIGDSHFPVMCRRLCFII